MKNKEIVGTFLGAVAKQDAETMRKFANANYIQHNPSVPSGLEPSIGLLPILKENGTYAENVRLFQDGNYVLMHNIWHNAKPFGADEMVAFDIIRVDENGKVAEHWDVIQEIPTEGLGHTVEYMQSRRLRASNLSNRYNFEAGYNR